MAKFLFGDDETLLTGDLLLLFLLSTEIPDLNGKGPTVDLFRFDWLKWEPKECLIWLDLLLSRLYRELDEPDVGSSLEE